MKKTIHVRQANTSSPNESELERRISGRKKTEFIKVRENLN